MEVDRSTYLLWKQFSMPTQFGTRQAISVSSEDGKKLLSAYTLMIDLIFMQLWTLTILIAISALIRKPHSPNIGAASAAIWNSQGSPFTIMKLMAKYLFCLKNWRDWLYVLLWMFAAVLLITSTYVFSIGVPRFLLLGNGAPVNPESIYVPEHKLYPDTKALFEIYALAVPASFRAFWSVNSATLQKVSVGTPLKSSGVNGTIKQVDYAYKITAADFGLQHAAGLVLNVEGSCITEYGWLESSRVDVCGTWIDTYRFASSKPNNSHSPTLSLYDGKPPIAYFYLGPEAKTKTNTSFAIAVSSAGRTSFTQGLDPLYATSKTTDQEFIDNDISYTVMTKRPILSCWENDVWSYRGHKSAASQLSSLPNLNMPDGLAKNFFERSLGIPMILSLGISLGSRALHSASAILGQTFDAGSASMEGDLRQLVAASYIASKNILTDTTTINRNLTTLINAAVDPKTGKLHAGAADFIVTSSEVATISIKVLITIPIILILLFILITIITQSSSSWNKAQALQATVLYSCLDERSVGRTKGTWNRCSYVAYYIADADYIADAENLANLKPEFQKETGLYWSRRNCGDKYVVFLFFLHLSFFQNANPHSTKWSHF